MITGWEIKETSCFLSEIFPSTVNQEKSELNHTKAGKIWQLEQISREILTIIPIKVSNKQQANEVKER